MNLKLVRQNLLLGSAFVVSGVAGGSYGSRAYAACIASPSPTYICSGTNTTTQSILNVTGATVSTLPGFSVNTADPSGIEITGGGDISFTDANASPITASENGLYIRGLGGGSVTVDVTGEIKGTAYNGVFARNNTGGTSLTVTTGAGSAIEGGYYGIFARNQGTGALSVTANGEVTGNTRIGIFAYISNTDSTGGLAVTTGPGSNIYGGSFGTVAIVDGSGGLEVTANGDVRGETRDGIYARIRKAANTVGLTVTTDAESDIEGGRIGIYARNYGTGTLEVTANGEVTGNSADGINAKIENADNTATLTVTTGVDSDIYGKTQGIYARTNGGGALVIAVNGDVRGETGDGIRARNINLGITANLSVTTAAGTSVTGAQRGILAENYGTGGVTVEANGIVTGATAEGIRATTSIGGTGELRVTTGASSEVEGKQGILAENRGIGTLTVEANGSVTGTVYNGIDAKSFNTAPSAAMTVSTGAGSDVSGVYNGIYARQYGKGNLTVTADGVVEGSKYHGIYARMTINDSTGDLRVTTVAGSSIAGGVNGIFAQNSGLGAFRVEANGDVTGTTGDGIRAVNYNVDGTAAVNVTAGADANVKGDAAGIYARNAGAGKIDITADGSVVGRTDAGIFAFAESSNTAGISIVTGADSRVQGEADGILAFTQFGGPIDITIGGDVSGYGVAVSASSAGPITLNITGNVFNRSGLLGDQVISLDRGPTATYNAGTITGYVLMSFWDDKFVNSGTWRSTGDNDFSAGDNEVNNTSAGLIDTGGIAGSSDTTNFIGVTRFINAGTFSMSDQSAGDGSTAFDTTTLDGDYEGDGGTLAIDAFLGGPGSQADELTVKGNSSGTTFVAINNTNGGFATYNPDGILFATVEGMSDASNFMLAGGPLNTGLYAYDVVYDDTGADGRFLLKNFAGLHAFEVAAVVSGSQSIFFDTTASWVERQNQLRDWNARRGVVVAVADPPVAEDVNETGLWLSLRGTTAERDAGADWNALGKSYAFDTGYDQTTWSLMGGADFGVSMGEGSLLFGVLAGYFNSAQDLNASDTEIDYEGGSLGAYATFLSNGFFASVLGKADFMGVDYSPAGGPEESTNGTNLGLRADVGYRFSMGAAYLEPVASLAAVWTSIDDFELYNTTAEPGTNDAVQLGGGARFGWETASLDLSLTGRVWDAVSGDNEVGLVVPGTGLDTVTDAGFDGVFGEVSGQAAYRITGRVAANLSASYLFNENQTALSGAAGVSVSW